MRIYRKAYGVFACAGILFNHESPRRGENYVTRKIARGAARIARGLQKELHLGTLTPKRDWSYAPDIVDGIRRIVSAPKPDDFVLASGVPHSVGDFCEAAFRAVGLDYGKHVVLDPEYVRLVDITRDVRRRVEGAERAGMGAEDALRGARPDHGGRRAGRPRRARGRRLTPPAVLVPAFRRVDASRRAIRSLFEAGAGRILYVDDTGEAGGDEIAREFPSVDVVRTTSPVWWTGAIVLGIAGGARTAATTAVLFFNQDVTCAKDYFEKLAEAVAKNPGALVGSAVMYAQEPARVWSAGGAVEWWGRGIRVLHHGAPVASLPNEPFPADWLFGMGTYVPVEVFDRIGLPDAERFPMAWGDLDFSLRARRAGIPVARRAARRGSFTKWATTTRAWRARRARGSTPAG